MGYSWAFLAVRVAKQMLVQRPPVLGGAVLGAAFVFSAIARRPQHPDAQARAALRADQRLRLRLLARGRTAPAALPAARRRPRLQRDRPARGRLSGEDLLQRVVHAQGGEVGVELGLDAPAPRRPQARRKFGVS